MPTNAMIEMMLQRKSIRKYTDEIPTDEVVRTVVRAGQQAPFAYQICSVLLSRKRKRHAFKAPLLFTICIDAHRMELVMAQRGWNIAMNDLSLFFLGIQDAALMAQNMVMAAESLGMGSCFLGAAPYKADKLRREYKMPLRVFPIVQLAMGYPAENPPPRPRYPLDFTLFEEEYPHFDQQTVKDAMRVMDEGYLAQDYYRKANYIIEL